MHFTSDVLAAPGVNQRTLIMIRWFAVTGQTCALLVAHGIIGINLPLGAALGIVGLSCLVNLYAMKSDSSAFPRQRKVAAYLAFDLSQLSALLALTGGLENPFAILVLAPVIVATTLLRRFYAVSLAVVSLVCISLLALFGIPFEWPGHIQDFPALYKAGLWFALIFSVGFIAFYVWRTTSEARKLQDALGAVRNALAHQQQVAALGAQAAATAHELGSPLNTISLIASDLEDGLSEDSPHYEDIRILTSQVRRCRDILAEFAREPSETAEDLMEPLTPLALLSLLADKHRGENPRVRVTIAESTTSGPPPSIRKSPELAYGLGNLIQNAIQFARSEVRLIFGWDDNILSVVIHDDGRGFSNSVLARIGEPYISTRKTTGKNMGLGIFIARTLLEMTDASVTFRNASTGGAEICVIWSRNSIDIKHESK